MPLGPHYLFEITAAGVRILHGHSHYVSGVIAGTHSEAPMTDFKKAVVLDNELEARLMEATLKERDIPHMIKSYYDSAYDGLYQAQKGWGHVLAPEEYKEEIKAMQQDIRTRCQFEDVLEDEELSENEQTPQNEDAQ
jgi:hypothetical protein